MAKAPADIRSLARAHTDTAIRTLAGIVREKNAPASARVAAAEALLNRGWGKPKETIDITHHRAATTLTDDELLDIARGGGDGVADETSSPPPLSELH